MSLKKPFVAPVDSSAIYANAMTRDPQAQKIFSDAKAQMAFMSSERAKLEDEARRTASACSLRGGIEN